VDTAADLQAQLELAMTEANAAFADPRVYVERFVPSGRHVEVQILGDGGDVVHLGTRDCSVQRRYQKILEEAPAPLLSDALAASLVRDAVALARQLKFRGAGTVEFLVDGTRGEYYFLEVNARIQVEHPVTEMVTGIDLVAEQLAVAAGLPLRRAQVQLATRGHAIECRINAEDATREFRPSPGRIVRAVFPAGPGIRVDTHVQAGSEIPPFYDSLLAKIVVHAENRAAAVDCMGRALARCQIDGINVNTALHAQIIADPEFRRGGIDSGFLGRFGLPAAP
jgi:acetyl-CoA carboxylase biotin carboxylase subunit